ncbi:MAG: hypothetical protein MJ213_01820 [Bacilli bacterium]|nr:hypothetical protein [Bacilli bacterium]
MKKLLMPFILLLTIPFSASCIKEITFDVIVTCQNCRYEKIKDKAVFGKTYEIKLIPNEGFSLYILDGVINVSTATTGDITFLLSDAQYNEDTDILSIPGDYVNSQITIVANGQIE